MSFYPFLYTYTFRHIHPNSSETSFGVHACTYKHLLWFLNVLGKKTVKFVLLFISWNQRVRILVYLIKTSNFFLVIVLKSWPSLTQSTWQILLKSNFLRPWVFPWKNETYVWQMNAIFTPSRIPQNFSSFYFLF